MTSQAERAAVGNIVPGFVAAVRAASDYEETQRRMEAIFQSAADAVAEFGRILRLGRQRRGWKGHGAPPIYPSQGRRRD